MIRDKTANDLAAPGLHHWSHLVLNTHLQVLITNQGVILWWWRKRRRRRSLLPLLLLSHSSNSSRIHQFLINPICCVNYFDNFCFVDCFPAFFPSRCLCDESNCYRCWWWILWKQCQACVQYTTGTAILLCGTWNG